ncbi:hypothetical protein ACFXJ8_09645 [Nonomuraea sp. NPDC059194]|uniref:hypothetical protein n=1 Tax=Nonomuraea sp. NPDC059194 TaxID=3346764 RepID=UPI0036D1B7F1
MKRLFLAWVVAALVATGAGIAVLGLLGGSLGGTAAGRTMSDADVRAALAAATPPPSAQPRPSPSKATAAGQAKAFRTPGGTVVAACDAGLVKLRSWSPAQGYTTDDVDTESREKVTVEFESGERDVEVEIRCDGQDRPVMTSRR